MSEALGEKTEKPTPKRLKDAREKGQVAASRDLTMAAGTLAAAGALVAGGGLLIHRLTRAITDTLSTFDVRGHGDVTAATLAPVVALGGTLLAVSVGPVALAAAIGSALTSLGSTGFVGSSRVDLQACKLEYSIVSPK